MSAVVSERVVELVACPRCFGIPHMIELHHPTPGVVLRLEHHCTLCGCTGRVSCDDVRAFWVRQPPTA